MNHDESERLAHYLYGLAEREDRGALAALRSGLRPGHELDALRLILPLLYGPSPERENDAVLVAGLFALHPEPGSQSLAEALRSVARESESESIEARFRALLNASRADLPGHLRHAVSLVASHKAPLDWARLHHDIHFWDHERDFVRRRWAREFWVPREVKTETANDSTPTAP